MGGLRDLRSLHFESGVPCFPYDFPDTLPFALHMKSIKESQEGLWSKKPAGKRVNWIKLGEDHESVWSFPWKEIQAGIESLSNLKEPRQKICSEMYSFNAMANTAFNINTETITTTKHLTTSIISPTPSLVGLPDKVPISLTKEVTGSDFWILRDRSLVLQFLREVSRNPHNQSQVFKGMNSSSSIPFHPSPYPPWSHCLMMVRLESTDRGTLLDFARITLLTESEIESWRHNQRNTSSYPFKTTKRNRCLLHEEQNPDLNERERKKGVKKRRGILIGGVSSGQYSFQVGKGCGIGFITMGGLAHVLWQKSLWGTDSRMVGTVGVCNPGGSLRLMNATISIQG